MQWFRVPRDIFFGAGSMEHLKTLKGKRAVLVTGGSSMKRFGFLEEAAGYLQQAGIETSVIDGVEPNPSVETVLRGGKAMQEFRPDWIIAIGGGSALDAAKIMWVFYEHPHLDFEDIIPVDSIPELRNKAHFVAIPSTSGTASEITAFSVITDTETHVKHPIVSYHITPDIAIVDPKIPAKMPPHVTAHTGMDVMTHAIEAYVSQNASVYTDPLAMEAIKLTYRYLPHAYSHGDDLKARENMHNASTLAGMAFTNASLGIVHSLAHKIGGQFGIAHGLANAILLPYLIEYNYPRAAEKYQAIERELGVDSLPDAIRALNKSVGIPLTFGETDDVEKDKFDQVLNDMAKYAVEDPCTATNPRQTNPEDVARLYQAAYQGQQVQF